MAKIIFKAIISGIAAWIILNALIFFGTGIYTGFIAGNPNAYVSPTLISILRYASLFLAFGATAFIFLMKEKKRKTAEPLSDQSPFKQPLFSQPPSSPSSFSKPFPKPPLTSPTPPPFVPPKPAIAPTPTPIQTPTPKPPAPKPAAPTETPVSPPPAFAPSGPNFSPVAPKPSEPVKEFPPVRPPEPIPIPPSNQSPASFGSGEIKTFSPKKNEERDIHSVWPQT